MNELELLRSIDYEVLGIYLMMCLFALAGKEKLMTVEDLIKTLAQFDPQTQVRAWDADSEDYETVSGYLYDERKNTIELQTDVVW